MMNKHLSNRMKSILLTVLFVTIFLASPASAYAEGTQLINVTGKGVISLPPDIVKISIGIDTERENVQDSINDNTVKVESVKNALAGLGIADDDIKTTSYSLYSSLKYYRDNTAGPDEYIYSVYYAMEITLRDATKLNQVLDTCVNNGANSISGITYDSSGRDAAYDEARDLAIDDAGTKAEKIAEKLGVTIRNVDSITVNDNSASYDYSLMSGMGGGGGGAASPSINPGLVTITVNVDAAYAYGL